MNRYANVKNWYDLSALLTVPTHWISWLKMDDNKAERQQKVVLNQKDKKRITYKSTGALRVIQDALTDEFTNMFKQKDTEGVISYVPGVNAAEYVKEHLVGHDVVIKFDIIGYYDHVKYDHIADCMREEYDMPAEGAHLIAFLTTVKTNRGNSLQQGSPCSPMLSNLIGQKYIDKPVKDWLGKNLNDDVSYCYIRYSDNIAIGLTGNVPADFKDKFKAYVKTLKYKSHKWSYTTQKNPYAHQQFLGIVVNKEARTKKQYRDRVICTLFNFCVKEDVQSEKARYQFYNPRIQTVTNDFNTYDSTWDQILAQIKGRVAYMKSADEKMYNRARKLLWVIENYGNNYVPINFIKTYRKDNETTEQFIKNAHNIISNTNTNNNDVRI